MALRTRPNNLLTLVALLLLTSVLATEPTAISSSVAGSGADSDGDGFTDMQEISWNANLHDANSYPDLETGLVAWWPLDEGAGNAVQDITGNGMTGTLNGSVPPVWTADETGTVLAFGGAQSKVIVPSGGDATASDNLTVVAWTKTMQDGAILTKQGAYALKIVQGRLAATVHLGDADMPLHGHTSIADGTWHHVACSYDGFELSLYVDGVPDVRTHVRGVTGAGDGAWVIGQIAASIRDVAVYQRVFNGGELQLLYNVISTAAPAQLTQRRPVTPAFLLARRETPNRSVRVASRGAP